MKFRWIGGARQSAVGLMENDRIYDGGFTDECVQGWIAQGFAVEVKDEAPAFAVVEEEEP